MTCRSDGQARDPIAAGLVRNDTDSGARESYGADAENGGHLLAGGWFSPGVVSRSDHSGGRTHLDLHFAGAGRDDCHASEVRFRHADVESVLLRVRRPRDRKAALGVETDVQREVTGDSAQPAHQQAVYNCPGDGLSVGGVHYSSAQPQLDRPSRSIVVHQLRLAGDLDFDSAAVGPAAQHARRRHAQAVSPRPDTEFIVPLVIDLGQELTVAFQVTGLAGVFLWTFAEFEEADDLFRPRAFPRA